MNRDFWIGPALLACGLAVSGAQAMTLSDYLVVGQYVNDTAVDVSNYELGRVSANAASAPTVSSPGVGPTISDTPTYDGNVAVVNDTGTFKSSDVVIYADRGVDCAGSFNSCTDSGSNLGNTQYDDAAPADNLRSIADTDGVNGNVNLQPVIDEIELFRTYINGLTGADITGSIATVDGVISGDLTVNLSSGLNILDFSGTGSNDISVQNGNLIFQGGSDAFAIVLVNDGALFKTSQANLVIGNGGIGLNNVVIVSQTEGNAGNIDISNTDVNGVALYDLAIAASGGTPELLSNLSVDNMSGCTQLVGNDVDIQNVRLSRCAFDTSIIQPIPVPAAVWLFGSALGFLGWVRRKPV